MAAGVYDDNAAATSAPDAAWTPKNGTQPPRACPGDAATVARATRAISVSYDRGVALYFSFGSNMSSARLRARVGGIEVVGRAQLPGHRHAFDKLGADGTGKGNVSASQDPSAVEVWGALYELETPQLARLDQFEGGYDRTWVEVHVDGARLRALTYVAHQSHQGLLPSPGYLEHYLRGMQEHGIPDAYVRFIRQLAARPS